MRQQHGGGKLKPYILDMTTTVVVMADSPEHARRVAMEQRNEILRDADLKPDTAREVVALCALRGGWDGRCIPYGGDGDTRLEEMLPGQ